MEERNALIERTFLGVEDHGIFTFNLTLGFGNGVTQGFGNYALDAWDEAAAERVGVAEGTQMLRDILEVVDVERWEALVGKYVRARIKHGVIIGIGHITRNHWFQP